jgi:hypothetical protein
MTEKLCKQALVLLLVMMLMVPAVGYTQNEMETQTIFGQAELDQLLAPIALYPDSLLAQVLMAATYPLEVVAAARWIEGNPDLKGDALAKALVQKDWDPSVKSLVNFPTTLLMMNEKLEWTQKLGDAFLAQEEQVMETVQELRKKAYAQGNLESTREQHVTMQDETIIVEPADPDVIYVPVYNPFLVYGPWWYPDYPPYYYYPPGYVIGSSIIFLGVGVYVPWGYAWGVFDWPHRHFYISVNRHVKINRHINRKAFIQRHKLGPSGYGKWQHDPRHRKGVIYRDRGSRERFGRGPRPGSGMRQEFRGHQPDERTWERRIDGRPDRAQPGGLERPDRRIPESVREGIRSTPSGRGGGIIEQRERPPQSGSRQRPERERIIMHQERPRNAFDRIDRSGRNADSNSTRGRKSRQIQTAPRQTSPDSGRSWGSPGGNSRKDGGSRDRGIRGGGGRR